MHVTGLVHLLGSLIEAIVEERGGVAVLIHRVALRQQLFLNFGHILFCDVNGEEVIIV